MIANLLAAPITVALGWYITKRVQEEVLASSASLSPLVTQFISYLPFIFGAAVATIIVYATLRSNGVIGEKYTEEYQEEQKKDPKKHQTYYEYVQERLAIERQMR